MTAEGSAAAQLAMLRQILGNTVLSAGTKVIGLFVSLGSVAITSRLLGPEGRGYLAVVASLVGMTATLGHLSLGQVVLKHAGSHEDDDWLPTSVGVLLMVAVVVSAVAVVGISLAIAFGIASEAAGIPLTYLMLGLAGLPLTIWTTYSAYLLLASGSVRRSNMAQLAGAGGGLLAVVVLVMWLRMGVAGALVATIVGLVLNTAVSGYYLMEATRRRIRVVRAVAVRYLIDGAKLHLTAVGAFIFASLDILMVHHYHGPAPAGLLQLATQLFLPLLLVPQALSEVLSSKLGTLGPRGLWPHQRRLMVLAVVGMAAVAAVIALAAPLIVRTLAGPQFAGSVPILRVYLLAVVGATINTTMGVQWIGRGMFLHTSALTFAAGIANFVFNLVFIPKYGAIGAATATVVGVYIVPVTANLILAWRCEREMRSSSRLETLAAEPSRG